MRAEGWHVDCAPTDKPGNTGLFAGEIKKAVALHRPNQIFVTESAEWRVAEAVSREGAAAQLAKIIADGVEAGVFGVVDSSPAAGAALNATLAFHHPNFVQEPMRQKADEEAQAAIALVIAGSKQVRPPG